MKDKHKLRIRYLYVTLLVYTFYYVSLCFINSLILTADNVNNDLQKTSKYTSDLGLMSL